MTVFEASEILKETLLTIYGEREASNISDMILERLTGFTKTQRLIFKQRLLNVDKQHLLKIFTEELLTSKPIQYVLNEAWFGGLNFYVDENVLIPRPETEELVEAIIIESVNENFSIIDIGTGSGCIAITLKKKLPSSVVYALDISIKALDIAGKNAKRNDVNVNLIEADILNPDAATNLPVFDVIVSNPPYIKQAEAADMLPNVLQFEPHLALFVDDEDPLLFYKAIADFALQRLSRGSGKVFFEINEAMGNEVSGLLKAKGFAQITVKKDLQGKDRVVRAVLR